MQVSLRKVRRNSAICGHEELRWHHGGSQNSIRILVWHIEYLALKVCVRSVLTPLPCLIYIPQHVCEGKILCSEIVWAADLTQRCYEEVSDVIQREQTLHRRQYLDVIVM